MRNQNRRCQKTEYLQQKHSWQRKTTKTQWTKENWYYEDYTCYWFNPINMTLQLTWYSTNLTNICVLSAIFLSRNNVRIVKVHLQDFLRWIMYKTLWWMLFMVSKFVCVERRTRHNLSNWRLKTSSKLVRIFISIRIICQFSKCYIFFLEILDYVIQTV